MFIFSLFQRIRLEIQAFHLQANHDFMRVYDGDSGDPDKLLYEYTGLIPTPAYQVTSYGSKMYVTLTTDGSGQESGFTFTFTSGKFMCIGIN